MTDKQDFKLKAELVRQIEAAIKRDERIEIVPTKDGAKVFRIKRNEIKDSSSL